MEKVKAFDANMTELSSSPVDRKVVHEQGLWHETFDCWVIKSGNPNKLILQKRGTDKKQLPNLLDISAAGHLTSDENIEDGIRELHEELGFRDVEYKDLKYIGVNQRALQLGDQRDFEFGHTHFYLCNKELSEYHPQLEEVDGLFEISIKDILKLFSDEVDKVEANGIIRQGNKYISDKRYVSKDDFVPYRKEYYIRICIMAERFLNGEKYLAV